MILLFQSEIKTREDEWLVWEDPFVMARNPEELKREKENSLEETEKRLSYAMRMVETMDRYVLEENSRGEDSVVQPLQRFFPSKETK